MLLLRTRRKSKLIFFRTTHPFVFGCFIKYRDKLNLEAIAHGTDCKSWFVQSDPPLDPKLFIRKNFLHQSKFKCLGVAPGPKITPQLTLHAHGRDWVSKIFQSNHSLDPKLFSKIFHSHSKFECLGVSTG